jgi:hypothetical protein
MIAPVPHTNRRTARALSRFHSYTLSLLHFFPLVLCVEEMSPHQQVVCQIIAAMSAVV